MADGITTGTPVTPSTGGLNYADYEEKIRQAAAKTRSVTGSLDPLKPLEKWQTKGGYGQTEIGKAAIEQAKGQAGDVQTRAERAASALEMAGASTLAGMKNLETLQAATKQSVQSANETWGMAAEKADEYVKASRGRVGEVLTKLDEIQTSINKDRDFAKAHAMQASVQAAIGSMKGEERNIAETYGTDSKEYQQFQASKISTLATVQSNIHASFQQLREEQNKTYMNAFADVGTKMNMYIGYQEQQHVEMLKYQSQAKSEYALQEAGFQVSVEQMKMAGMENLANWIVETPTFTIDNTPLFALLGDLSSTAANIALAEKEIKATGASSRLSSSGGGGGGYPVNRGGPGLSSGPTMNTFSPPRMF